MKQLKEILLVRRYDIYSISRPATPIAMLAYPLLRHFQKQFAMDSMAAMRQQLAPLTVSEAAATGRAK
jgi:hypothetical protein